MNSGPAFALAHKIGCVASFFSIRYFNLAVLLCFIDSGSSQISISCHLFSHFGNHWFRYLLTLWAFFHLQPCLKQIVSLTLYHLSSLYVEGHCLAVLSDKRGSQDLIVLTFLQSTSCVHVLYLFFVGHCISMIFWDVKRRSDFYIFSSECVLLACQWLGGWKLWE